MASSLFADYGNQVKQQWLDALEKARKDKDWEQVDVLLAKMKEFNFTE